MRTGFGDIVRSDGTVIRRKLGSDFDEMVQFAMFNRLDNERSTEIYRLYAVHKHHTIIRSLNCRQEEPGVSDLPE